MLLSIYKIFKSTNSKIEFHSLIFKLSSKLIILVLLAGILISCKARFRSQIKEENTCEENQIQIDGQCQSQSPATFDTPEINAEEETIETPPTVPDMSSVPEKSDQQCSKQEMCPASKETSEETSDEAPNKSPNETPTKNPVQNPTP